MEAKLDSVSVEEEELREKLAFGPTRIKRTIADLERSIWLIERRFRILRLVTITALLTVGIGIVALFSIEESFVFGYNSETVLVVLTACSSGSTFFLLTVVIWELLRLNGYRSGSSPTYEG